jgi:hypothetical protein
MAPNEAQETCYILLKFANGELGMGTLDFIKKPFYMLVYSEGGPKFKILYGMKLKLLLCKLYFLRILFKFNNQRCALTISRWQKDQQCSFQIPVVGTSNFRKWPLKAAILLACSGT